MTGYEGSILRVDLDKEKLERCILPENTLRMYLGGTGFGAKVLYDEVPAGIKWSDPENRLIIASGPLNATAIGGSGSVSVVSKGPLTDGAGCSQANGFFGAYLRLCGLNGIVIYGKADGLKYLYLDSESEDLMDAEWLRDMDTYKTPNLIKHYHSYKERDMSIASIGPAGENLVKFAGIFFDHGHSASHNGLGAVMGSKNLKAIAIVKGRKEIPIKDPDKVRKIAKKLIENVKEQYRNLYDYGTLFGIHSNAVTNMLPVKNYTTSTWKISKDKMKKYEAQYIREKYSVKRNSCWACQIHHCDIMKITEGPYAGEVLEEPEYEQLAAWSSAIGVDDVTASMMLSKEVDMLGLETNEAGWVVGFAIECYEKGILTKKQVNQLELKWGNAEAVRLLLRLIARKQGVGKILSEGVMRAARKIGGEAVNFAIHTMKGNTPRGHDHRNRWTEMFDTIVSNTGTLETWGAPIPIGSTPDWRDLVNANLHDKGGMMFEDSLVVCRFNSRTNVELLSQAVAAVTGWDFNYEEGITVGRRIVHLLRAFNVKHGLVGRDLDKPSTRYGSPPDSGPAKGKSLQENWDMMLNAYYSGMGWDKFGRPLPNTLERYGLDYVAKDMAKIFHQKDVLS